MPETFLPEEPRRGLVLVLSSPSGAGKTSIARALMSREAESGRRIDLSISVTTRARRPSEADGVHYHFRSLREFETMRDQGDLLEWAEVHGHYYGTPLAPVQAALEAGEDVLFDIDWQGTRQVMEAMPQDVATVFILPPSVAELRTRLERRAEDAPEVIARRLQNAKTEIGHWREYQYLVVNHDLEASVETVRAILRAERQRRDRQPGVQALAEGLIEGL